MVYRLQITYDENVDIVNVKYVAGLTFGYKLPLGVYENNLMLNSSFPDEVKVNITIDDIRLKSTLTTNETNRFNKKQFFQYTPWLCSISFKSSR